MIKNPTKIKQKMLIETFFCRSVFTIFPLTVFCISILSVHPATTTIRIKVSMPPTPTEKIQTCDNIT